jgi:hypothetical protein
MFSEKNLPRAEMSTMRAVISEAAPQAPDSP